MLSAYANQTNWDLYLPLVLFAYRSSPNPKQASTSESPFYLLYGREPRLPSDLDNFNHYRHSDFIQRVHEAWVEAKRHILKQAEVNKRAFDAKYNRPPPEYKVGDSIRLFRPLTKPGLKNKLRNDKWGAHLKIPKSFLSIKSTNQK